MSFAPVRLGNTVLEAETAAADRKSCRRFGPCGVGEKALYLNDLLIDRHFYVGFGSVRRVFKRVAMSQGGFSGKGAFGSIPYLVVQYDDGQEKQCTFKREEDVDELLAYLGQVRPEIPRLSVGGEQRLAKKAQQALTSRCNQPLDGPAVQVKFADTGKTVQRLAVISGAGGSLFEDALAQGADCLLTGEANHHHAIDAKRLGLSLIAAGHYATEFPVTAAVAEKLRRTFPALEVLVSEDARDPYTYL